jgi:hypothetical protein
MGNPESYLICLDEQFQKRGPKSGIEPGVLSEQICGPHLVCSSLRTATPITAVPPTAATPQMLVSKADKEMIDVLKTPTGVGTHLVSD